MMDSRMEGMHAAGHATKARRDMSPYVEASSIGRMPVLASFFRTERIRELVPYTSQHISRGGSLRMER